jgi:tripartite-type tricarboxylate transporter receptor subunit TctC
MKALLGPVLLENQAGAGGVVGAAAVARARPDGYTLMLSSGGPVFVAVAGHVPYDPAKDFEPVSILGTTALAIVTHPSVPAQNLSELIGLPDADRRRQQVTARHEISQVPTRSLCA